MNTIIINRSTLLILFLCSFLLVCAQEKVLTILHTSDTHSRIEPIDPNSSDRNAGMGGVIRRAAYINEKRAEDPELLLFDCGDFSQGTPYYNFFKGEIEIQIMNEMGYTAATIGNHEFDFGIENMARLFKMANFPIVCINYEVKNTPLEGLVKPYLVLERKGLKIGIFGVAPKLEGLVQSEHYGGIVFHDPIPLANAVAEKLKKEEKCDLVICLSHLGLSPSALNRLSDEYLIQNTKNIDLVLGGHSHSLLKEPKNFLNQAGESVPVMHVGSKGVFVGELTYKSK